MKGTGAGWSACRHLAMAALLLAWVWAPARGAEETVLRFDPFAVPKAPPQPAAAAAPAPGQPGPAQSPEAAPPLPQLRAVLAAGAASLANINGTVLAVGEEIDGYRLLGVSDDSVVIGRRGRRLHLHLYDEASNRQ